LLFIIAFRLLVY